MPLMLLISSFLAWPALGQSEGFILTRPDCVPGAQQDINYIQGPDPILAEDNDIHIFVDVGECCVGGWEGIFNLQYPGAASTPGTPRFHPIWGANNFGTNTSRNEHEAPFPSLFWWQESWHIAYTSTFFPLGHPNRDRAARIDINNLTNQANATQVTNRWVEPVNPSCRPLGSCSNKGTGVLATAVIDASDILYLYHPDKNLTSCDSKWIRHQIAADLSVVNPGSHDGCLTFSGRDTPPPFISDIALGSDERLYMLARNQEDLQSIQEWVSSDGLSWSLSGAEWRSPDHPTPGWIYHVWDAGYLKDKTRKLVHPRLVVSQISDGTVWEDIVDASLGRWYLYYWAEAGANLPPNFGQEAHSCDTFGGFADEISCDRVLGWAWDSTYPDHPTSVELWDNNTLIARIPADGFRQDLLDNGIGDGFHAFGSPLPGILKDGQSHNLAIRIRESDHLLTNGTATISCPLASFQLSTEFSGDGSGQIASSPPGIDCGADCSESFVGGTEIVLSVVPSPGSVFTGWGGGSACGNSPITLWEELHCIARIEQTLFADGFESGDLAAWATQ